MPDQTPTPTGAASRLVSASIAEQTDKAPTARLFADLLAAAVTRHHDPDVQAAARVLRDAGWTDVRIADVLALRDVDAVYHALHYGARRTVPA